MIIDDKYYIFIRYNTLVIIPWSISLEFSMQMLTLKRNRKLLLYDFILAYCIAKPLESVKAEPRVTPTAETLQYPEPLTTPGPSTIQASNDNILQENMKLKKENKSK